MAEDWEKMEGEDDPCPLPDRYYNINFGDGGFDRIEVEEAEKVEAAMRAGETVIEFNAIHGGRTIAFVQNIAGLVEITAEIREYDRRCTRWLRLEAKRDKYLQKLGED